MIFIFFYYLSKRIIAGEELFFQVKNQNPS
jgi:hypothetical protein